MYAKSMCDVAKLHVIMKVKQARTRSKQRRQDLGESGADCVTASTFNNSLHKQRSIFPQQFSARRYMSVQIILSEDDD